MSSAFSIYVIINDPSYHFQHERQLSSIVAELERITREKNRLLLEVGKLEKEAEVIIRCTFFLIEFKLKLKSYVRFLKIQYT